MQFNIEKLILWSNDINNKPRIVKFEAGKLNIITGASRTGKSAIIPIIDFCLGSSTCKIPVNTIRDNCSWFGIVVKTKNSEILLARKNPRNQQNTSAMYMIEDDKIVVPSSIPSKNCTADIVKKMLDDISGLTNLKLDPDSVNNGFNSRPGFKDLSPFVFQPQNIVANPDILFYKADTYEHRQKLKNVFPYALNAITPEIMAKREELASLKTILDRKMREFNRLKEVSERWITESKVWISKAVDYGIISSINQSDSFDVLYSKLVEIANYDENKINTNIQDIDSSKLELIQLKNEQSTISTELNKLRSRYLEMEDLKSSTEYYKEALYIQQERLKISDWFAEVVDKEHVCPLCNNHMQQANTTIEELSNSLKTIENDIGDFEKVPASFEREYERVRKNLIRETEKLESVQHRIMSLENKSEEIKKMQYTSSELSRFIGNVQYAIQTLDSIRDDGLLSEEIEELKSRILILTFEIDESSIRAKITRAVAKISSYATSLMTGMDTERPEDPLKLMIDDLTIKVIGELREDFLWEIGSGSNWLAYHVGIILSLQKYFIKSKQSSVPSFVVFDQPSQVYFPKVEAKIVASDDEDNAPKFEDEEVNAVKKIFTTISAVIKDCDFELQAIVLDHAPASVWDDVENVNFVEEWRNGKKLVPMNWIE